MSDKKSAKELVASNLHYIAKAKLEKMPEAFLSELLEEYVNVERDVGVAEQGRTQFDTKASLIDELLRRKNLMAQRMGRRSPLAAEAPVAEAPAEAPVAAPAEEAEAPPPPPTPTPTPTTPTPPPPDLPLPTHELPDGEATKLIPAGVDGVALEVTVAPPNTSTRIFKERHELHIASFNSLKLRTTKLGLEDQWLMLIATLSTFDIVLVQEVPSEGAIRDVEKTRAYYLKKAFEHHSGDEWTIVLSEPCGPGNLEVHVALVRKPIEVIASCTNRTACGVPLDHAPLTIKIKDTRFKAEGDQTWVLTSVHFPPKTRSKERDVQIHAFLKDYSRQAAFRLDTPLTEKGAKDARRATVHHLVCGDFNCFPGEFGLDGHGFAPPLLGEHISTSSGGCAYDNFLMSKFGANKFSVDRDVLELSMPFLKDQDGLSDHSPVVVKIRDTTTTKKKSSPPKPKPEAIAEEGDDDSAAKTADEVADEVAAAAIGSALAGDDGVVV